jgi:hypothetical protein
MKGLSAIIVFFLLSCKQKPREVIVKDNIKSYLAKSMHDFKSYEPVQYGAIDSIYSSYHKSERNKELTDLFHKYHKDGEEALQKAESNFYINRSLGKYYSDMGKDFGQKLDSITKIMKKESKGFNPQFVGYEVLHSFRGKNVNGATVLSTEYFILDSALNVISTEEYKEEK